MLANIVAVPGSQAAQPFNWRALLQIHPAAELFPLMSEVELRELADDIEKQGLRAPIIGWASSKGQSLLDGRNRLDALALRGLLYETDDHHVGLKKWDGKRWTDRSGGRIGYAPGCEFHNLCDGDPYAIVLSLNVHRRHLNAEQKRELIAKVIKANPEKSNRQIAAQVKVASHPHIAKVRAELEKAGDVETVSTSIDTKGRKQPAKRKGKAGKVKTFKTGGMTVEMRFPPDDASKSKRAASAEVSLEQRKAEMAALADATDPRTAEDAKYEAAGKEVASGRALADFKFSCRTWLPKMTVKHRQEAIDYCADFAKPNAGGA